MSRSLTGNYGIGRRRSFLDALRQKMQNQSIVEEEQSGGQRAAYGKYVIPELSKYLTAHLGRGFSVTNLKQMRKFYQVYAGDQIGQTLSDQFSNLPAVSTGRKFPLSWSHYLKLMRIDNADQRHFYEIEAAQKFPHIF